MGTHIIPRADVKGQDRFFIIFSVPGLIGTVLGVFVGYVLFGIFSAFGATALGLVIMAICGVIGFAIGQVKVPDTNAFPLFKKIGGEYIRDIIVRFLKFGRNKKKYVHELSKSQNFEVKEDKLNDFIMGKK